MEALKFLKEAVPLLMKIIEDIRSLADSIYAVCSLISDYLPDEIEAKIAIPESKKVSLEQVRGLLAEKSRAGHTAEIRAIIQKHGADRLSDIDPKDFETVMKEAEVL